MTHSQISSADPADAELHVGNPGLERKQFFSLLAPIMFGFHSTPAHPRPPERRSPDPVMLAPQAPPGAISATTRTRPNRHHRSHALVCHRECDKNQSHASNHIHVTHPLTTSKVP